LVSTTNDNSIGKDDGSKIIGLIIEDDVVVDVVANIFPGVKIRKGSTIGAESVL